MDHHKAVNLYHIAVMRSTQMNTGQTLDMLGRSEPAATVSLSPPFLSCTDNPGHEGGAALPWPILALDIECQSKLDQLPCTTNPHVSSYGALLTPLYSSSLV